MKKQLGGANYKERPDVEHGEKIKSQTPIGGEEGVE